MIRKKTTSVDGIRNNQPTNKNVNFNRQRRPSAVFARTNAAPATARKMAVPAAKNRNVEVGHRVGALRIIPLGGMEEVGRNMTVFEYEDDIILLDMGMQFPEEDMPGIDYIIPNVSYLKGKEKNIRGVIFSHGHLDHIGAAPILLKQLGYPPIIGRDLTIALVKKKLEDYDPGSFANLRTIHIKSVDEKMRLGKFDIGFFDIEHSIMDAVGVILSTPSGTVIHPGDWTMDVDPIDHQPINYEYLSKLPRPTILMLESLGATDRKREKVSEREMYENLKNIISTAPGRVIVGTFSSQIRRVGQLLEYAAQIGKKVALDGYSMKMNVEIAKELGYIKMPKDTLIPISAANNHPDNKLVIICTGAQGEKDAVLSRIVTDSHRNIKLKKSDTIIFSSSVIPGNERSIQRLKDNLYRKCDNVIHSDIMDVHVSGHCNSDDIKTMLKQVRPDYFLPVYANHFFLKEAEKLAVGIGFSRSHVFVLDNGSVIEFADGKAAVLPKKVKVDYVFVDGLGIGDIGQVVIRDRQVLAADGMFMITILIDSKTKEVVGNPQVTSRGFIYVKENFDLVNETKRRVRKAIKDTTSKGTSIDKKYIEDNIRETVGSFLFQKTQRRPMVLPVIIEV